MNLRNRDTECASGFAQSSYLTSKTGLKLLDLLGELFFLGRPLFLGLFGQILRNFQYELRQPLLTCSQLLNNFTLLRITTCLRDRAIFK